MARDPVARDPDLLQDEALALFLKHCLMVQPVFRFAPSPNGELHLGHAYSALFAYDMARACNGRFLLRIEDIDLTRCRPEYEAQILDDLAWLGLKWEEPVRRQSEHFDTYGAALRKLDAMGILYPCFASRAAIARAVERSGVEATDPDGAPLYPGLHRDLPKEERERRMAKGEPYALRLHMARALACADAKTGGALSFTEFDAEGRTRLRSANPGRWGDAVIARKEVPASYHLAVVVDDALQGVTHVTRGLDLYAATDIHRLLQVLLDLPVPLYHHHPLLTDAAGRKLSKRHKDKSLKALRAEGLDPSAVRALTGIGTEPKSVKIN